MTNTFKLSNVRKLTLPAAIILLGAVSAANAGERHVSVRGGKMATRMVNGKMILTGVQGSVGGGRVHMAGRVPMDSEKANTATVKFDDLSLAEATAMIGQPGLGVLFGNVEVSGFVKGRWQGDDIKTISSSADGTLTINAGPGVITNQVILNRLEKLTGIADLAQLKYSSISIKAKASDGKIVIESLTAEGPNFNLAASGTYLAKSDNLDIAIEASVSPEMAAKSSYMKLSNVMGFLRGEEKPETGDFIDIPRMIVSGEIKKPDVRFDKSKEVAVKADVKEAKPVFPDSINRVSKYLLSQAR